MKQTISVYDMREAFRQCDRYNHFSYDGYQVLFDALEDLEDGTGEELEFDVIALCCDFVEMEPDEIIDDTMYAEQWAEYLGTRYDAEDLDQDELIEWVADCLNDHTWVCGQTDSTVIFQQF
jgi:hypothetical protein